MQRANHFNCENEREREKERTLKLRNTEYIEGALNRKDDRRLLEGEQFV